jgi:uncharacterized membrane protein
MFLRMGSMNKPVVGHPHRYIKKQIKLTLVTLPVISFLFGVIITFMCVNFERIFKTELSMVVFSVLVIIPTFIGLIGNYSWLRKIFKQIDMLETSKT